MLPSVNFNPSIANLTALHGMGGFPHPLGPVGAPLPVAPMQGNQFPGVQPNPRMPLPISPMPVGMRPSNYGIPQPANGLNNLQAIMQLLGRRF